MSHTELETLHFEDLNTSEIDQLLVDAEFWDYATTQFDEQDMLVAEREALLEVLLQRPAEAFMIEATNFAATYYADRAVMTHTGDLRFFTRDATQQAIDSMTTINDVDGVTFVRHEMGAPMTYGYDNPVEIIASSTGEFHIYTTDFVHGLSTMREVTHDRIGHEIMQEYFTTSLQAAREVQKRSSAERLAADNSARNLYYERQDNKHLFDL